MAWRRVLLDGALWFGSLFLSCHQMRAEALLRLELEQEESGSFGERAKLGHLADSDVAVAHEAG